MNAEFIIKEILGLIQETGKFIAKEAKTFQSGKVEIKSFNQLVSYVDKTAEEMLVSGLNRILPEAGFITEEETIESNNKPYMWVIDPLDGTTNFVHGVPVYSISVSLLYENKPIAGVVYEINREELFYAWEGGGAWMNGQRISVTQTQHLADSLLATGFPYYDFEIMQQYLSVLQELLKGTRGMRRMGSAAVDLAYVACGRFDGFFEYGLHAWDVAGGIILVQEAGGLVSDFKGGQNYLFGDTIIAAAPGIDQEFKQIISSGFNG